MRLSQKQLIPVLDDEGDLVGTISIGDFLRCSDVVLHQKKSALTSISEGEKWTWDTSGVLYIEKRSLQLPDDMTVKDAMSPEPITVNEHTSIVDCAKKMHETKLDSLPVMTTENELGGIIRDIDLLKILLPPEDDSDLDDEK